MTEMQVFPEGRPPYQEIGNTAYISFDDFELVDSYDYYDALENGGLENMLDDTMITFGLSGQDIIRQTHSAIFDLTITDSEKVRLMDKTGEIEFRIVEGSNERIQLEALLAYLVMVGGNKR